MWHSYRQRKPLLPVYFSTSKMQQSDKRTIKEHFELDQNEVGQ